MYHKVSRDPIYSEIMLYPVEILIIDTKAMQRLRYLSQLVGAEYVYPGATHTRFAHSLGVMHLSGVYAEHLYDTPDKVRILRLAGLLHDIGHGPFSHQFDDVVYKRLGFNDGHDEYRTRLLREYFPKELIKKYEEAPSTLKKAVLEDLEITLGELSTNMEDNFAQLMEEVIKVYEGEEKGTIEFAVVQGPLGADRLDFVLRDSYYAGTRGFGTGSIDRLIRNSKIVEKDGKTILAYDSKVVDEIYTILFGRFMMYKNVYFHKTSRAADMMIQELLDLSYKALKLDERVLDIEKFLDLTDQTIINEVIFNFYNLVEQYGGGEDTKQALLKYEIDLQPLELDIVMAYEIVERLKSRNLWKVVLETPFSIEGVDPTLVSQGIAGDLLQKIRLRLERCLEIADEEDMKTIKHILGNFDEIFKIDTPYKLTIVHPEEFLRSNIYILKKHSLMTFEEYVRQYPAYNFMKSNLIQIVRIYVTKDIREILEKYKILPETGVEVTTRW
ncbi:MAG: HD domain-containing protein [Fervidobacterium pennivorans]|uniref:HD domain-containing protein n=3 Tax=Fervidobacterium TaxID=2422 RepID=A0A172T0X3_FERPE|nr:MULTISPECIES: HD domain-containing protein [Fervidobacterium]AFG35532.1 HD superfamily phosphohydrolase [Fervidobacterium pennivorans DSM 9078]ANE40658.1 metal-dependent phosphohydrolase [Fervidobacterium pennivorans]NPU88733.1 HD domain-containing protein [Fervidobacterium sp.]QAV33120.1 HD domain-containing protein [Fervidobacterium changbaicum]QIV78837.1 HD domain-containing protein [Fervidobacterium pennivorans subsp. keratinolyticus]